jgi:hypothetical protein
LRKSGGFHGVVLSKRKRVFLLVRTMETGQM